MGDLNIWSLGIEDAWEIFSKYIDEEDDETQQAFKDVKHGINIKFNIYSYIYYRDKTIHQRAKEDKVIIYSNKRILKCNIEEFNDEITRRNNIMKEFIEMKEGGRILAKPRE